MKRWDFDTKRLAEMAAAGKSCLEIAKELFPNEKIWTSRKYGICVPYERLQRHMRYHGIVTQHAMPDLAGEKNAAWKGGVKYLKGYRYIYSPNHPNKTSQGYVAEHRLVMEKKLGRYLTRSEVVHHIDSNILNNQPDNLELFDKNASHLKHELTGHCPNWTENGLQNMKIAIQKSVQTRKKKAGLI